MQALVIVTGAIFRHGYDVGDGVAGLGAENNWRCGDADLWNDLVAAAIVGCGLTGGERGDLPVLRAGVGVEGVDTVMFGGNDEDVVRSVGNGERGKIKR